MLLLVDRDAERLTQRAVTLLKQWLPKPAGACPGWRGGGPVRTNKTGGACASGPGMRIIATGQDLTLAGAGTAFLSGGGEMANLIRLKDWNATPLGPVGQWPQSLRSTVSLCLASGLPINIIWGPGHVQIYNDGYRTMCGDRHPAFLGMDYRDAWAAAWPVVGDVFSRALDGETCFLENQNIFLKRNKNLEEAFLTFSFSPIRDETGGIGGLFHLVTETTATMLAERRARAVRDLAARLGQAKTNDDVFRLTAEVLSAFSSDLPFVLCYRLEQSSLPEWPEQTTPRYRLVARTGLPGGTLVSPWVLEAHGSASPWPVAGLGNSHAATAVTGLSCKLGVERCGPYDEPPDMALAMPIILPGSDRPDAILIAGASARLPFDNAYRDFFELVAATLAAGLANVAGPAPACIGGPRNPALAPVVRRAELPADTEAAVAGRPRIVLADHNPDMRAHVCRILRQAGYAVEAVADGATAVAAARRERPELLVVDVTVPALDGFGVLRALRDDPAMQGLPVIFMSARADEELCWKGLAAGANDYLVKPFGAGELLARVDGAVRLMRERREAAERERELREDVAAQHAQADLHEREQRLGLVMEAGRLGSWELDLDTKQFTLSGTCRRFMGLDPSEALENYDDVLRHVHPEDRGTQRAAVERAVATRTGLHVEYRALHPDGHVSWVEIRGNPVYAENGKPVRMTGVSLDISARKQAEERQKVLLDELNHRVKNTLATVQSIAMQTQRNAKTPARFSTDLAGRIEALARAHDLLTRASWDGASLAEVISQAVASYVDCEGRVRVEASGPFVRLSPNAVVTLSMAFHELGANAATYGALSTPEGRMSVCWNVEQCSDTADVDILWCEMGGPKVEPPNQRGFGSRLLERGLPAELGGVVNLQFAPGGVCCRMRLPVSAKITLAM